MKEMLKNKIIIGLAIFIVGVTYINSVQIKQYEEKVIIEKENIVMNIK